MSNPVGFCERWDSNHISEVEYFRDIDFPQMVLSIASCFNIFFANVYNNIMEPADRSKWIKIPSVLILDAALLLTTTAIALAEGALRLALAVITLPALILYFCTDWGMLPVGLGATAFYSITQIPNAMYTVYLSLTDNHTIDAQLNAKKFMCGII